MSMVASDDGLSALDILYDLVLEDGRKWGEAAEQFQLDDANAILAPGYKQASFLTRARGGSKSTDIAAIAVAHLVSDATPRQHNYVVSVAEEQSKEVLDAAEGLIARTPGLADYLLIENETIWAANGAQVHVLTSDGSSAWGKGRDTGFIILDEFAQWPETRRYRKLWVAMLTATQKTPGLRLVILTSAGEPGHFSYSVLKEAREGLTKRFWYVGEHQGKIPWVTQESLEMQRPHLTEAEFRRLHFNEWTEDEDRLLTEEDWVAAAVLGPNPLPYERRYRYIILADIGVKVDPTVLCVQHTEPLEGGKGKRVVVDRLIRLVPRKKKEVDLNQVEELLFALHHEYGRAPVYGDPSQFIQMRQDLTRMGVKVKEFKFSPTSVGELGSVLVQALQNRQVWLPNIEELHDELMHVRLRQSSPGVYRLDHDPRLHDDQAVCIGMGVHIQLGRGAGSTAAFRDLMEKTRERREIEGPNPKTGDPSAASAQRSIDRLQRSLERRARRGERSGGRQQRLCHHRWRYEEPHDCMYNCGAVRDAVVR